MLVKFKGQNNMSKVKVTGGKQPQQLLGWLATYETQIDKLAPYGTNSRLFTTDVSAKFKVT